MARKKKESDTKPEPKTFGYVVGRPASQQEHPDKKEK